MKNYKKIFSLIILLVLSLSVFSLSASAGDTKTVTVNNDLTELTINGAVYYKFNSNVLYESYYNIDKISFSSDNEEITDLSIRSNEDESVIIAYFSFANGDEIQSSYIHQNSFEGFNSLLESPREKLYIMDYSYYDEKIEFDFSLIKDDLERGKYTEIRPYSIDRYCYVCTESRGFYKIEGFLLEKGSNFYFLDCEKENIKNPSSYQPYSEDTIYAVKITNEEFNNLIVGSERESAGEENVIFSVIFIIIFGVIPFAALIVSIVFFAKTKKFYRKLWASVAIVSAVEILTLIITMIILWNQF